MPLISICWGAEEKECAFGAITVEGNVAYIDHTKCRLCRKCVKVCPRNAIVEVNFPAPKPAAKPAAEPATEPVSKPAAEPAEEKQTN